MHTRANPQRASGWYWHWRNAWLVNKSFRPRRIHQLWSWKEMFNLGIFSHGDLSKWTAIPSPTLWSFSCFEGLHCWFTLAFPIFWVGEREFHLDETHFYLVLYAKYCPVAQASCVCVPGHQGTLLSCLSSLKPRLHLFHSKELAIFKKCENSSC